MYKGEFYTQKKDDAVVLTGHPAVANFFMEHFEEKALNLFHHSLKFWGRYFDDTMAAIPTRLIDEFTTYLNNLK